MLCKCDLMLSGFEFLLWKAGKILLTMYFSGKGQDSKQRSQKIWSEYVLCCHFFFHFFFDISLLSNSEEV